MNTKITKIGALTCAITTSLFAIDTVHAKGFNGFYIGGSMGGEQTNITHKINDGLKTAGHMIEDKSKFSKSVLNVGTFIGYNQVVETSFIMGAELFLDTNFNNKSGLIQKHRQYTVEATRKGIGYGGLARFGYLISPQTAIYGGIGGKSSHWTFTTTSKQMDNTQNRKKQHTLSLLFQTGVEGIFGDEQQFGWRISYSFLPGRTITQKKLRGNIFRPNGRAANYSKFTTRQHNLSFGLSYRF